MFPGRRFVSWQETGGGVGASRERLRSMETLAMASRGVLAIDSSPPGCTVIRDGQTVGAAPIELQDLPEGRHRIQLRCGATYSLVHPVEVAARTRATVSIDAQLDGALSLDGATAGLRYPSVTGARERVGHDLALLGRALGAHRVYGVIASEDRVVVVDVSTGAVVGESPVTDGGRLRGLRMEVVGAERQERAVGVVVRPRVVTGEVAAPSRLPVGAIVVGALGCVRSRSAGMPSTRGRRR